MVVVVVVVLAVVVVVVVDGVSPDIPQSGAQIMMFAS